MAHVTPATLKTVAAFRDHLQSIAPDLDCDDAIDPAGAFREPLDLGFKRVGNRFVIHPMEGWDGTTTGDPSVHTLRRWRRFGQSGAKWIWGGEAFAVTADGRANPNQLYFHDEDRAEEGLGALLRALRDEHRALHPRHGSGDDLAVGLQLTHSGRFSKPQPDSPKPRILYRHPILDARVGVADDSAILSDAELESIADAYVRAAMSAEHVGFDFVDIKCCHGYLLHESLSAHTRPGKYGGFLRNRTALLRRIIDAIRDQCPRLAIGVRLSVSDVIPYAKDESGNGRPVKFEGPYLYGFGVDVTDPTQPDFNEPLRVIESLREMGVRIVNLTLGSPYYCPHLQRPATYPPSDGYPPPDDPLRFVATQIRIARSFKRAFPDMVFVGTAYSYLQEYLPHVAQYELRNGFIDAVGLGRIALSYPELPSDVLKGLTLDRKKLCRTFSDCTTAPRHGLISGCYPLDPYYRAMPEAEQVKAIKAAQRGKA